MNLYTRLRTSALLADIRSSRRRIAITIVVALVCAAFLVAQAIAGNWLIFGILALYMVINTLQMEASALNWRAKKRYNLLSRRLIRARYKYQNQPNQTELRYEMGKPPFVRFDFADHHRVQGYLFPTPTGDYQRGHQVIEGGRTPRGFGIPPYNTIEPKAELL